MRQFAVSTEVAYEHTDDQFYTYRHTHSSEVSQSLPRGRTSQDGGWSISVL